MRLRKVRKPNTSATSAGTATTASRVNGHAVERPPEQRQLGDLVPHHEVGQHVPVHALGADLEHEVHAHRVGAQPEEDAVAQRQHAGIAPDQVDAEGQDGVGEELAEEVQREVGHVERRAGGRRSARGSPTTSDERRRPMSPQRSRVRIAPLGREQPRRPPLDEEDDQRPGWPPCRTPRPARAR